LTTEEKLQHFKEASLDSAREKSALEIREYKEALNKIYKEHKASKRSQAELEIKTETDHIKRENNKSLSAAQLHIKRKLTRKHKEITDKLFDEIKELLTDYRSTPEYKDLLISQIKNAQSYVKPGEELIIYIDPADEPALEELTAATGAALSISEYSFLGGTRSIITDRHILMDNSFTAKLDEMKEHFNFTARISEIKHKYKRNGGSLNG